MNHLAQALDRLAVWWMRRRFWPPSLIKRNPTDDLEGMSASIASLASHPGFIYLVAQLQVHKARIESKEAKRAAKSPTTMDEMIARTVQDARDSEAIFRLGWLHHIVSQEVAATDARRRKKPITDPWLDPLATLPERPDSSAH